MIDSDARRSSTKAEHGNLVIGRDAELRYIVSSGRARAAIRRRHRARRLTRLHRGNDDDNDNDLPAFI